jgi:hypothetical protein
VSVLQIKTKIVSCHTADSKPVKQEVNGTVILPPLVFTGKTCQGQTLAYCENYDRKRLYNTGSRVAEKGMTTANKVFLDACINIQDEQSQKYLAELNDLVSIF